MTFASIRQEWLRRPVREMLAGAVATFALIPEVIAFAEGRPAMISAAAGSVALVAAPLVHAHGLPYLLAASLLAGTIQIVFGLFRLGVKSAVLGGY